MAKGTNKHRNNKKIVKLLLAHQGIELAVINGEWRLVCQCEDSVPAEGKLFSSEDAQSDWHAQHIVKEMRKKGFLK